MTSSAVDYSILINPRNVPKRYSKETGPLREGEKAMAEYQAGRRA
jgi:hypothetical protein